MEIAVVGAGIAGLACAAALARAGVGVAVFDKGRAPGGRMATRRFATPAGEARADHGAQYFTARGAAFAEVARAMVAEGAAAEWRPRGRPASDAWYVGTPGMSGPARWLAGGLDMRPGVAIARIEGTAGAYRLRDAAGALVAECGGVVIATPAEQAAPLLSTIAPAQAAEAADARSAPCWAVLAAFEVPAGVGFDVARPANGALAWVARDASKPGRGAGPEVWVAHLGVAASRTLLEAEPDTVIATALGDLARLGLAAPPIATQAHRWRYAMVETPAPGTTPWNAHTRVGACGDWRGGPRVEAAWASGVALAAAILAAPPL